MLINILAIGNLTMLKIFEAHPNWPVYVDV